MVAEGLHSLVDASDGTLLLVGRARSQRPPDAGHPFGHGKEIYFWTLIVAVIFFAVGGGVSVYEGILHLVHPEPLRDATLSYIVLGVAALFDGSSFIVALRTMRREEPGKRFVDIVRHGKDPASFTVVLEDLADLTGIAIAFLGVWLGHRLTNPYLDSVASIGVGLVLATVATVLVAQSRKLLLGERTSDDVLDAVRKAAAADGGRSNSPPVRSACSSGLTRCSSASRLDSPPSSLAKRSHERSAGSRSACARLGPMSDTSPSNRSRATSQAAMTPCLPTLPQRNERLHRSRRRHPAVTTPTGQCE
jgi:cation diffusion facilitator family transporter